MYKKPYYQTTSLKQNENIEGERLETKLERIMENNEPITDGAPIIHTAREDGVQPDYDIRADKWEYAVEAMDVVSKTDIAKRKSALEDLKKSTKNEENQEENGGKPTSAVGTDQGAE